jgi:hypothetical protein
LHYIHPRGETRVELTSFYQRRRTTNPIRVLNFHRSRTIQYCTEMNEMQGDASSSHGTEKSNVIKISPPEGGVEANRSRENISSLRSNAGHCVDFSPPKNILKRSNANKNVVLTANVVTVAKDNNAIPRDKTTHKMVRVQNV